MDYNPRAETVRMLAAAAYLPLVALVLLAQPQQREVRLIRFHCYQALALSGLLIMGLMIASAGSGFLTAVPAFGFELGVLLGISVSLLMLGVTIVGFYGAIMAFQGNYTHLPILTEWVTARTDGQIAAQPPPPRRKRKRPPSDREYPEG